MNTSTNRFPHQRLDAYRVALELLQGVERLATRLPRGAGDHKDQLRRAAGATVRNLAEGTNRSRPRDKAARFVVARAECGECEASLEMIEVVGLAPGREARRLRILADRLAAMLTGLIRRQHGVRRRAVSRPAVAYGLAACACARLARRSRRRRRAKSTRLTSPGARRGRGPFAAPTRA